MASVSMHRRRQLDRLDMAVSTRGDASDTLDHSHAGPEVTLGIVTSTPSCNTGEQGSVDPAG